VRHVWRASSISPTMFHLIYSLQRMGSAAHSRQNKRCRQDHSEALRDALLAWLARVVSKRYSSHVPLNELFQR